MRQRLMTGRQLKAHLLVAIDFAAPAGDRDELSESAYRIYNTMLFARELPALQAAADEWARTLRRHPRRAFWVRTSRFAVSVPLPSRRPRRIIITALQ